MRELILAVVVLASVAEAAPKKHEHPPAETTPTESEFVVDKDLLEKMYSAEVTEVQVETRYRTGAFDVAPQISFVNPQEFKLINNYFSVPHQNGLGGAPLVHIVVSTPIARIFGYAEIHAQGSVGYTYRQGMLDVTSQSGASFTDRIQLHWLPFSVAGRLGLPIPGARWIKLSASVGAGAQWVAQDGELDGIDQHFWIPFYYVRPGITLFDFRDRGSWFGGLFLGATSSQSVGAEHVIKYWSADISISMVL